MKFIPNDKKLILFDGVCNLCNASVQFIINHDKQNKFLFAPLESKIGQDILQTFKIDPKKTDSIVLYDPKEGISVRSSAALTISKYLGFPVNAMIIFYVIPPFIRNAVYDFIAENRYKWYGKKDACMIPTPELKAKFLE